MKIVRNILAVLLGLVIGSMVNMGIIMISGSIIPPPEGVDMTTTEGLQVGMHLLEPKHYIFPFLAHALGTFVGALVAYIMAVQYKKSFAIGIGVFFLIGGVVSVLMLPSPIWYTVVDLLGAYIPFAYLAVWVAQKK